MLDAMRRGVANILVKILLGLLIVAFALWGVPEFVARNPWQSNAVATVGKKEISIDDFKRAYQEEMETIARRIGRTPTPEEAHLLGVVQRTLAAPDGRCRPRPARQQPRRDRHQRDCRSVHQGGQSIRRRP